MYLGVGVRVDPAHLASVSSAGSTRCFALQRAVPIRLNRGAVTIDGLLLRRRHSQIYTSCIPRSSISVSERMDLYYLLLVARRGD